MSKVEETRDIRLGEYNNRPYSYNKFNEKSQQLFNYTKMSNLRIIQKKLLYVIGLSSDIASKEVINKLKPLVKSTKVRIFRSIREDNQTNRE